MTPVVREYAASHELVCDWSSWQVAGPGRLTVFVGEGHCTDMTGTIRIGMRLMPDVCEITVVSGDEIDTIYRRDAGGWFSDSKRWSNGRRLIVEQERLTDTRTHPTTEGAQP